MTTAMAVLSPQAVGAGTLAMPDTAFQRLRGIPCPSVSVAMRAGSRWKSVTAAAKRPGKRGYVNTDEDDGPIPRPSWRKLRPLEERLNIRVEKNITAERAEEIGVWRWSKWETGPCAYSWDWRVDQEVFIVKGAVKLVPEESEGCAWFYAGDFVRFPKWLNGHLSFEGPYEERYRFRAYGDD